MYINFVFSNFLFSFVRSLEMIVAEERMWPIQNVVRRHVLPWGPRCHPVRIPDDLHVRWGSGQIACALHRADSVTDKRATRAYGPGPPVMNARRSAANRRPEEREESPRREPLTYRVRSTSLAAHRRPLIWAGSATANNDSPLHAATVINRSPLGLSVRTGRTVQYNSAVANAWEALLMQETEGEWSQLLDCWLSHYVAVYRFSWSTHFICW